MKPVVSRTPRSHAAAGSALAESLAVLADPVRLRLLHLLDRQELAVLELADVLQLPQSTVSRHLKVLAGPGFVSSRAEGTANFYRLASGELPARERRLWELAAEESRGWSALAHDRLRLERTLATRGGGARRFFAGVASEWDRLRTELYGDQFTGAALAALLPPDAVVADLACGSGAVTAMLAPAVGRVFAVDASPEMLEAARARVSGFANVELSRGDLSDLPIEASSCDAALLLLALTHVESPAGALAEAARILRPGGRLVVVDLLRHDRDDFRSRMEQRSNGFEAAELEALVAAAGLVVERARPLPPAPAAKGPALLLSTAIRPNGGRDSARRSHSKTSSPLTPERKVR